MAVSRETLYEEVWAEPMTTVAKRYNVSSNFLARVCDRLRVPHPLRGYWAKLEVGKAPKRPPLPEALAGDEIEWTREGELRRAIPKPPDPTVARQRRPASERPKHHPLIVEARPHFEGAVVLQSGFLKPAKRNMVDIVTSNETLPHALKVANDFFITLEDFGHRVVFGPRDQALQRIEINAGDWNQFQRPWHPDRPTVVFVGTVAFGLTIYELREERIARRTGRNRDPLFTPSYPSSQNLPSGKICIRAYSPYSLADWKREWKESAAGDLTSQFTSVVDVLTSEASTIVKLLEEGEVRAATEKKEIEAQIRDYEREVQERETTKVTKESRDELLRIIEEWSLARRIEDFFEDAQRRAATLGEQERAAIVDRLKNARHLLGGVDALKRFRSWKPPEEKQL